MILTAARTGEARLATWDEIDIDARVWTVPASRMKAGRAHRVPLSDRALEILAEMQPLRRTDFVFPGRVEGQPLGPCAFRAITADLAVKATPHGFRSAFRDWAGDCTSSPRETIEAALAHAVGNAAEQAYRRSDALAKRRELMQAWGRHCEPGGAGNVLPLFRSAQG